MAGAPNIDLETAEPAAVYNAVAEMAEDDFAELMDDPPSRTRVIEALVAHMAELFRGERAGDLEAVIHIKLWDRPGGGYDHLELLIANAECRVLSPPEHEPSLTLKVRPTDLRAMLTGETGPRRLALKGRLRVLGDLGLGMQLPELFAFEGP